MKRFAKSTPPNGTEITQKIQSYDNGEIDLATLTDWLVDDDYAPGVSRQTEARLRRVARGCRERRHCAGHIW